ncbi:MAG TPA: fused MFS/spermidine synthase [Rariglobus sp.]
MRLPLPSLSQAARSRMLQGTVVAAVALAAFLSFSVQPLVGKLLLPVQGGAASTWLGTMVYFQIALLLGYGWAFWLLQRKPLLQVGATVGLGVLAMAASQLGWIQQTQWTGLGGVVLALAIGTLPAMVLLFSTGPLMHGWLRRQGQPVPYHLYAFSNAGSLLAVLLYPFTIERSVGLSMQMIFWQAFFWVFVGLVGIAGFLFMRDGALRPQEAGTTETITYSRAGCWLGLSMLSCVGMLGATHHLAAEIGSGPLAWVGPFGAFLFSFLVTFSGWWQPHYTLVSLGWLTVSLTGFMLTKGVSPATVDGWAAFWVLSLTAAGSVFCNGLLHESRPKHRFALFYLVIAAGGVAGGLFASLGAPLLFLRPSEFLAVSCLLLLVGLLHLVPRRDPVAVIVAVLIVISPVLGLVLTQTRAEADGMTQVRRFRNIYGYMMLKYEEGGVILSNETTTHGTQLTADAASRRHPTLYYTESSGVGRIIAELQKKNPTVDIGVIGLGAGTLAAYARPTDTVDFWDVDPKAIRIGRDFFTFINGSPGQVHLFEADGRKGLEHSSTPYDLIVIDAFSGDAVPPHLLTREALAIYFKRLGDRNGILAIHVTSRYGKPFPVIAATAHSMGLAALSVDTTIARTTPDKDWDCVSSQYILVCRPRDADQIAAWLPAEEDDGRVRRSVVRYDPLPAGQAIIWTDERHAALDALDLRRFLGGK